MDMEKNNTAEEVLEAAEPAAEEKSAPTLPQNKQKPVYVYICILFVAAAMLIVISLLMQRSSHQEMIGQLQTSVNAIEALQESQVQNTELLGQVEDLEEQVADLTAAAEESTKVTEALQWLAIIEQQYSLEEYATCFESMEKFKLSGTVDYLPQDNTLTETALSPAERYAILEETVTNMTIE